MACCFVGLLILLDLQIQQRFQQGVHRQAAHIYARPVLLSVDFPMDLPQADTLLRQRGYQSTNRVNGPGQYTVAGDRMDLYLNPQSADAAQTPLLRLHFSNHQIQKIQDHRTGNTLRRIRLEPERIGSLQLGPHEDRLTLKLHEMPELLVQTLLAMEDRNFEQHYGVDPLSIARAVLNNLIRGRATQGGSTITQQLVKNLFLSPERTLSRKVLEALMAVVVELRYSKAEILEHYLNEIFLGQSGNRAVHGFALASDFYFSRPLDQLKPDEIATLVGIVPAPSSYNPRRHPERALKRRNIVLDTLSTLGILSPEVANTLRQKPLGVVPRRQSNSGEFPTYIDYLHRQIRQYFSEDVLRSGGLKLFTTLDTQIQRVTQRSLSETLSELEKNRGIQQGSLQGAAIVVDIDSGDILSLVGDRQSGYSGFNRAVDAQRPIGSLMKPLVFLTALQQPKTYSLATVVEDAPLAVTMSDGKVWSPENYDKRYRGNVVTVDVLKRSYNVPTVNVGLSVGVEAVIETIQSLGVQRDLPAFPSLLLGANHHSPLEVAQLYQPIANHGVQIPLRSLSRIDDQRGETIARFPSKERRVFDLASGYLLDYALKQVVASGTAARLNQYFSSALQLAGKTGTTDDYRDSWFSGYSGNLLTVVWVGRDDNRSFGLTGSAGAMRVWQAIMGKLFLTPGEFIQPETITYHEIDPESGLLANHRCEQRISLPLVKAHGIRRFAPCAGVIGKVQSWFNIKVSKDENKAPPSRSLQRKAGDDR